MPRHHGSLAEQRWRRLEQRGSIIEQRGSIIEQRGSIIEQRGPMVEQRGQVTGQPSPVPCRADRPPRRPERHIKAHYPDSLGAWEASVVRPPLYPARVVQPRKGEAKMGVKLMEGVVAKVEASVKKIPFGSIYRHAEAFLELANRYAA